MLDEVPACARALLAPRMDALEARLGPGCAALTWASMNIDGYLHYARQVPIWRWQGASRSAGNGCLYSQVFGRLSSSHLFGAHPCRP